MDKVFHFLRLLHKKWMYWTLLPLLSGILTIYLTDGKKPTFVSESNLLLNLPTNSGLSITNEEYKQFEISAYFQDLFELIRSKRNLERVRLMVLLDYLDGKNRSFNVSKSQFPWSDSTEVKKRLAEVLDNEATLDLRRQIDGQVSMFLERNGFAYKDINSRFDVYRRGGSNYVKVQFRSDSPFDAAYHGRLLVNNLISLNRKIHKSQLVADRALFEKLVKQAREKLNKKVKQLESYKISNDVINLPEHTKAIVNQMVNLEVQRAKVAESMATKKEAIVQIKMKLGDPETFASFKSKNEELIEAKNRIRQLRQSQNTLPDGLQLSTEISSIISDYAGDVAVDLRSTKQDLLQQLVNLQVEMETLEELVPLVSRELERIKSYARTFAPLESNIATLEREIQTAQESYLILINKLNLAKSVEQGTGENELVIIDPPSIPIFPEASKRKIIVVLSVVATAFLIIFILFLVEFFDKGVWSLTEFESHFGIKAGAAIPSSSEKEVQNDPIFARSIKEISDQQVQALALKLASNKSQRSKVFVVSALQGEGKRSLTRKICRHLRELNRRTLITDADIHSVVQQSVDPTVDFHFEILPPAAFYTLWQSLDPTATILWIYRSGRQPMGVDLEIKSRWWDMGSLIPVLNNMPSDRLDDISPFISKSRSLPRRWVKQLLTLQLKNSFSPS